MNRSVSGYKIIWTISRLCCVSSNRQRAVPKGRQRADSDSDDRQHPCRVRAHQGRSGLGFTAMGRRRLRWVAYFRQHHLDVGLP